MTYRRWSDEREICIIKYTLPSKDLIQTQQRSQKFYREAKTKRFKRHQTSTMTTPKGTCLCGKEKATIKIKEIMKWKLIGRGKQNKCSE